MKNKRVKVLSYLDTGIFPATIMFASGMTYAEIAQHLKKSKAKDWLDCFMFSDVKETMESWCALRRDMENIKTGEKKVFFYIIIGEFDFSDMAYCKLAHECLHICQFFLPDALDRTKEFEAEAYLHTHLMKQCLTALRGTKK
jgi:hypothetical protein